MGLVDCTSAGGLKASFHQLYCITVFNRGLAEKPVPTYVVLIWINSTVFVNKKNPQTKTDLWCLCKNMRSCLSDLIIQ